MQDALQAELNITLKTSIKLEYSHGILKRKQERAGQAIKHKESLRKVTENQKKRSCMNMLLNMVESTQPLLGIATAKHSHLPQT